MAVQTQATAVQTATATYTSLKSTSDSLRDAQLAYVRSTGGGLYSAEDIASGTPQYVNYQVGDQTAISMGTAYGNAFMAAYAAYQAIPKHATGLDYVPHDDYIARLHEGERVQTKAEASAWRSRGSSGDDELKAKIDSLERSLARMNLDQRQETRDNTAAVKEQTEVLITELKNTSSHLRRVTSLK
jgi:hypothetical protein